MVAPEDIWNELGRCTAGYNKSFLENLQNILVLPCVNAWHHPIYLTSDEMKMRFDVAGIANGEAYIEMVADAFTRYTPEILLFDVNLNAASIG